MSYAIPVATTDEEGGCWNLDIWFVNSVEDTIRQIESETAHFHVDECLGARCRTIVKARNGTREFFALMIQHPEMGTIEWDSALKQWDSTSGGTLVDPTKFCEEIK